jgi:glycerophosphoryl diester phosphodiesterase
LSRPGNSSGPKKAPLGLAILAALALALLVLASSPARAGESGPRIKLFAHRGFTLHQPENSLGALRAAYDLGLYGSEIDLGASRDGVIVLMHDADVKRTTNGQGRVGDLSWAQLQRLRLKARDGKVGDQGIPSLARVLERVRPWGSFHLVLDLKAVDARKAARLVLAKRMRDRVTFFVAGPEKVGQVHALRSMDPRLRASLGLSWWWRLEGLPRFAARALRLPVLFAPSWLFPQRGFSEATQAGAQVWVYLWGDHDLPARAAGAVALGASGISCDRPDRLLHWAGKVGRSEKQ